jgi:hypothetical protein
MQHMFGGCKRIRPTPLAVLKYPLPGITMNWDFLT